MSRLKFNLPAEYDTQRLIGELANHYAIRPEPPVGETLTFFDTFDWRLYHDSLVLYESGGELYLRQLANDDILQRANITTLPVFSQDLPEGVLKERLKPVIEMRALMKLTEVQVQSTPYRILNQDEKTVVWLIFEAVSPADQQENATEGVWLRPVRGYIKEFRQLAKQLQAMGCPPTEKDIYFQALEAAGKEPGDYSAKLDIQLDPQMRADVATKVILRFLLDVMKSNQAYIKEDIDTEFLHDFRVAVRRTRAALSQVRAVFPAETTARFKQDFAYIGKLSNDLRDLDVYLLAEDSYRAMLPDVLRNDIDPLFGYLRQKRSKALRNVVTGLNSKKYAQILNNWEAFLAEPPEDSPTAGNAGVPIIELAQDRIYKRYRRIVKDGRQILEDTQEEMLHALRIECKKLRYLLEFFAPLFPADKISTLIRQLKRLQDNLGDFNDFCVQEDYLLNIAGELARDDQKSHRTMLAIGSLIGTLDQERHRVKGEFAQTFTAFTAPVNKALFKELFAAKKKEVVA